MKFLFLSGGAHLVWDPTAPKAAGGAELQVALMARELVKRGHEAVLLGTDTGQTDGAVWEGIRVRNGGNYGAGGLKDTALAWRKIHRILREERADFVVVYGWTSLLYLLAKWRKIIPFNLVFVCALDAEIDGDFRRKNPVRGWVFHRGMELADVRLSITEDQARQFRKQGMECSVTRLLLRESRERREEEKTCDLLWVARCEDVKRPNLFLDIAEGLSGVRCCMIVTPHDRELFEEIKKRALGMSNVEFIQGVAYRDIQGYFDRAKIFVNTSSHEGVPNTFIHAGLGETAIASLEIDPDGMFKTFAAGVQARGDYAILAEGVRELLDSPKSLLTAASESARFVREWHNNERNVAAFLSAVGVEK